MAASGVSLVSSVLIWIKSAQLAEPLDRANGERLGIFVGLWVPSLILMASYLTRKADDEAVACRQDVPFLEEFM